jgi:hypothetical protein
MKAMDSRPDGKIICRILGFKHPGQCTDKNAIRVTMDPIISERRSAAHRKRTGYPSDMNIFYSYKHIPASCEVAHLDFPGNFDITDDACVLAIFTRMTEQERQELRDRVLDEQLQAGLAKCLSHDTFFRMSAPEHLELARKLA